MRIFFFVFILWMIFQCFFGCGKLTGTEKNMNDKLIIKDSVEENICFFENRIDSNFALESNQPYSAKNPIIDFENDQYDTTGIFTFRGGAQRNSPVKGILSKTPVKIITDWIYKTGYDTVHGKYGTWGGGAGWTGQPLLVVWKIEELKNIQAIFPEFKNRRTPLKEIIQVSLCGKIYFLDFDSGKPTRLPITISNPIKGTPSIDKISKNYLFVGQGVQHNGSFAWRIFNLKTNALVHLEKMPSSFAYGKWGACDASPLIDAKSNSFIWPTESGVIYKGTLKNDKKALIHQYRYVISKYKQQGIESSPAAYHDLCYFSDNAGHVFCVNLQTMKPRWHFNNTDDTDASPVLEIKNDTPYVFIGNEVDHQGLKGYSYLRKLNGLTGQLIWEYKTRCYSRVFPKINSGGMLSTPLVGINKAKDWIWTIFSRTDSVGCAKLVCVNIHTGKLKYDLSIENYSWVSPIALYDHLGNAFIYFSDVGGNIYLIDGDSGKIIFKNYTGYIFESSPIAFGNRIIQPARGDKIFSFLLQ
jgi:outer membrane protein assembly factor BamB